MDTCKISHDKSDESIEAKVRWFRSLTVSERMEMFCEFTELALALNPKLQDKENASQTKGRIRIISKA